MSSEQKEKAGIALTRTQRDAVTVIRHFRRQRKVASTWLVGDRRHSRRFISDLERLRLIREVSAAGSPVLTYIGSFE
jgi:hypothetical protein